MLSGDTPDEVRCHPRPLFWAWVTRPALGKAPDGCACNPFALVPWTTLACSQSSEKVRSQKALGGGFCPYLSGRKIADRPLSALYGRSGPDCRKRCGARRVWEADFVRTCRSGKLPIGLRVPSKAGLGLTAERCTEPEGPGRAILSVPVGADNS